MKRFRANITKKSIFAIIFVLSIFVFGSITVFHSVDRPINSHNCRFWGIVFSGELGPEWERIVKNHLGFLKKLSGSNSDGWGIGYYLNVLPYVDQLLPVIRKGEPRAQDDPRYDDAVSEMLDYVTKGSIAHIRARSSGSAGIPNPHPFRRKAINRNFDMQFAHNGTIHNLSILIQLINADYDYLALNPADYTDIDGVPDLDSDLYAIYIMKVIDDYPELSIEECITIAVTTLANAVNYTALNFVMTDGSALWAVRYYGNNPNYSLYYFPVLTLSDKWIAASELPPDVVGEDVPNHTLVALRPNECPQFYSLSSKIHKESKNNVNSSNSYNKENDEILFNISALYPNPCKDKLYIRFTSPDCQKVMVELYDATGRLVEKVFDGHAKIGMNEISYTSKNISSGIYFIRLETEKKNITEKVLFQR